MSFGDEAEKFVSDGKAIAREIDQAMNEKTKGIMESLNNLLVEGDLSPENALRTIAHYLMDASKYTKDEKIIVDACTLIHHAILKIESTHDTYIEQ